MSMDLTECRRFFERPATPSQRQYEALRAYFIEGLASPEVARRFGYTPAAFRMLCYEFRRGQLADFFAVKRTGPQQQPKKGKLHDIVVALRKRNYSIYDISHALKEQGTPLGTTAVREILAAEGFAPLPRRLDEERPVGVAPTTEAVADVRSFALRTGEFTTRLGGLFLFIPDMIRLNLDGLAKSAKLPGSRMIPAEHALRTSLALKLWSIERKSHVMALLADEGLAMFCGLNAVPKRSFLSEYSSRITPQKVSQLLSNWHTNLAGETILTGESINLDFHSVPYFGEDPVVESHYLSKRSRRQPSLLTFLAQDADSQVFCYSNADIRKGEEAEEIFRFIKFWERRHGSLPQHLVFDSRLTNYPQLDRLDQQGVIFITLRRRTRKFRTPDIGSCKNVRSGPDQAAATATFSTPRLPGEPGKARPIRRGGWTANRIRWEEPGKTVAVLLRMSHRAWAASVRCGELSGANVICSSLLETLMSPAVANSSCSRVRPSSSMRA